MSALSAWRGRRRASRSLDDPDCQVGLPHRNPAALRGVAQIRRQVTTRIVRTRTSFGPRIMVWSGQVTLMMDDKTVPNQTRDLSFADDFIFAKLVEDVRDCPVEDAVVVNISP
ncbi:MAG: hypothetical protein E5W59_16920, partial [Mesorhizobium sp.]